MTTLPKQSWLILALSMANAAFGQTWTRTITPFSEYQVIACSADGTKMIAGAQEGSLYLSTNSGATWSPTIFQNEYWYCVASSADGSKLFAGAGNLFISTNSGLTWITNFSPSGYSTGVACSADGTKVAVALGGGEPILLSTNSGATFTSNSVPDGFCSIVSSADGTELTGMFPSQLTFPESGGNYGIYRSMDSGATWTQTKASVTDWVGLACSADGKTLAAVSDGGILAVSRDSGHTWTTNSEPGVWTIACSADGTRLIAGQGDKGQYPGVIFTSLDSGQTWVSNNVPTAGWTGVAMSADGSFLAASADYDPTGGIDTGGVFTAQIAAQPTLSIVPSGSNLQLSWPLPSAGFVLQQSSQLNSTDWVNLTNVIVASGYYNQVTVSPPQTGNAYYRLANQ